ncbi:xylulokinase [Acanthopleuribacter pedis]|uniref:Xylulose kinase n=1 Tax=Acanthopleuribacter pedis TaxID=442870 RepID=A0A8J7QSN6_9BACT|nr:xylulokinase [Acanthopleuribacter pedis]MBO1323440.1 xylulokinase [Acanthopleuribacter pedis]
MRTVLGIDLGTQSLKVVFYDFVQKRQVAVASAPLTLNQNGAGLAEQEPNAWTKALILALAAVDQRIRASATAVAVSGQQHGLVLLDREGVALRPATLWCDTTCAPSCDTLHAELGGAGQAIKLAGNPVLPGYTAGKLKQVQVQEPEVYRRIQHILLPHDYLNYVLTGTMAMEFGDASGTAFFDVRERAWSKPILHALDRERDIRVWLPPLIQPFSRLGSISETAAALTGLPAGIPVATGGGDNMMAAIGTGNLVPGRATISLGTSGTLFAYADQPVVDPNGEIAAFCSATGGWLPLLCTMNCTLAGEWGRRLFGYDMDRFEALIAEAPAGSEGVITLPFFSGERTPNLPNAKAWMIGLDGTNGLPRNLLRAAVEGATFALRFGLDALRRLELESNQIVLTGGGSSSATWRQIVADVCNKPVVVLEQDQGAAFGAALQALALLEGIGAEDFPALVNAHLSRDEARCHEPNPTAAATYRDIYQTYRRAVEHARHFSLGDA